MDTKIRRASREDIEVCGEICYRAFCQLADHHKFLHEFPGSWRLLTVSYVG